MWQDVHPTGTALRFRPRRQRPLNGRCAMCGGWVKIGRDAEGDSETGGKSYVITGGQSAKYGQAQFGRSHYGGQTVADPQNTSGCKYCGSYNWRGKRYNNRIRRISYDSGIK